MATRIKPRKLRRMGIGRRASRELAATHNIARGLGASKKQARRLAVAQVIARPSPSGQTAKAWPPSPSKISNGAGSSRPTASGRKAGNPPGGSRKLPGTIVQPKRLAADDVMTLDSATDFRDVVAEAGGEAAFMLSADDDLRAIYFQQVSDGTRTLTRDAPAGPSKKAAKKARKLLATAGVDPEETAIMLSGDTDPALLATWIRQLAGQPEPAPSTAPHGMDDQRYRLHTKAKTLAQARCDADPRLDPGEAYADAAVELADRDSGAIWLG